MIWGGLSQGVNFRHNGTGLNGVGHGSNRAPVTTPAVTPKLDWRSFPYRLAPAAHPKGPTPGVQGAKKECIRFSQNVA